MEILHHYKTEKKPCAIFKKKAYHLQYINIDRISETYTIQKSLTVISQIYK